MSYLKSKSITSIILFINLSLAAIFLFFGAIALAIRLPLLQKTSIQLFLLFCTAFLTFFIASFCFMKSRSIPTQILGDLLKMSSFPQIYRKNYGTMICYILISSLLLWIPLFFSSYFQKTAVPFIGFLIVWIMFYRAADYSERQILEKKE